MAGSEQVLVVARSAFEEAGVFQGLSFEVQPCLTTFAKSGVSRFMLRDEAETNPGFKQLIPYVVFGCRGEVFSYTRGKRSGEARLKGRSSIGVGGHINPVDDMPLFFDDLEETYRAAVQREVEEEIGLSHEADLGPVVALLNDDSTEVGQVHLGLVHYCELAEPAIGRKEQMLTDAGFRPLAALRQEYELFETWSQMCLDHLEAVMAKRSSAMTGWGLAQR